MVLVSTRTTKFTVAPVVVVVCATFGGSVVVLGRGWNAVPPAGIYKYVILVGAEQSASVGRPSFVPSGSVKSCV